MIIKHQTTYNSLAKRSDVSLLEGLNHYFAGRPFVLAYDVYYRKWIFVKDSWFTLEKIQEWVDNYRKWEKEQQKRYIRQHEDSFQRRRESK